jgi:Tfp pilus assembly protein PilZ
VEQQTRRKTLRVPVSCVVHLRQIDLNELAGKMFNLSAGGFGVKTNYPISITERLTVAFHLPDTIGPVTGQGQVVWRQFHGDTPGHEKTLFTVGIQFLSLSKQSRKVVRDYVKMSNAP